MSDLIIFTHIPKTAGSSFIKKVLKPNIPSNNYHIKKLKRFIRSDRNKLDFIYGHYPYGLHHFTKKRVKYITFLREPIDRAVSFYYFIKRCSFKHPLRHYVESVSLKEFYENKKFHNMETRYIAGFLIDKIYPSISSKIIERLILKKAVYNLKNKYIFGLQEKFNESLTIFEEKFGWKRIADNHFYEKNLKRPKVSDLDDKTIEILKKAHKLDLQLYDFAFENFDKQFKEKTR